MKRMVWVLLAAGCDRPETSGGHAHIAPHGGTLVELGEHFAQIELVLDPAEGRLTAYVLDGHAERPIRLEQKSLDFRLSIGGSEEKMILSAVRNPLTGETEGDSSEFSGRSDRLKGATKFAGTLVEATIRGRRFENAAIGGGGR